MRTTVDIPDELLQDALRVSHVKTKTMAIVLGLKELIHRHHLDQVRALRGRIALTTNLRKTRGR